MQNLDIILYFLHIENSHFFAYKDSGFSINLIAKSKSWPRLSNK